MNEEGKSYSIDRIPKSPEFVEKVWPQMANMLHPIYSIATHFCYHAAMKQAKAMMANWDEMEDVTVGVTPDLAGIIQMLFPRMFGRELELPEPDSEGNYFISMTAKESSRLGIQLLNFQLANVDSVDDAEVQK